MINLIFTLIGGVGGWFLKFAFDRYHDFKTIEMERAKNIDDILINFKALEKLKIWEKQKMELDSVRKPKPM